MNISVTCNHYEMLICRYNESCLHGVITASKMLFLSESVRDVVDIKLSKKYNPPVNILGKEVFRYIN